MSVPIYSPSYPSNLFYIIASSSITYPIPLSTPVSIINFGLIILAIIYHPILLENFISLSANLLKLEDFIFVDR